jgi:hypothetical protein
MKNSLHFGVKSFIGFLTFRGWTMMVHEFVELVV